MKHYLLIFALFLSFKVSSQLSNKDSSLLKKLTIGIHLYDNNTLIEAGIIIGKENEDCHTPGFKGLRLTTEIATFNREFFIAPKIGYEATASLIALRAGITCYTNFKTSDYRFTPQAGISLFWINLYYGYNFALGKNKLDFISKNSFSASINL